MLGCLDKTLCTRSPRKGKKERKKKLADESPKVEFVGKQGGSFHYCTVHRGRVGRGRGGGGAASRFCHSES